MSENVPILPAASGVTGGHSGGATTSTSCVSDDLGISRAALYYYVDDLQDLVFQCYRHTCETLSGKLAEAVHSGGDEAAIIARFIGSSLDPACPEFASLSEIGYLNDAQRAAIMGLSDAILAQLAGIIAKGVSAGRLRTCDAWIASHTIMSMIFWAPMAGCLRCGPSLTRRTWRRSQILSCMG